MEVEFSETRIYHQQTSPTKEIADIQVATLVCECNIGELVLPVPHFCLCFYTQYWWAGAASASLLPLFLYTILVSLCCQCLTFASVFIYNIGELVLPVPHFCLCFIHNIGELSQPVPHCCICFVRNIGELVLPVPHCCLCFVCTIGELVLPVSHRCLCLCTQHWWADAESASLLPLFCMQYWRAGAASVSLLPLLVYTILASWCCQCLTVASACVHNIGELILPVPHFCLCFCKQHRFALAASAWPLTPVGQIIGQPDWEFRAPPPSHHKYSATVRRVDHNRYLQNTRIHLSSYCSTTHNLITDSFVK